MDKTDSQTGKGHETTVNSKNSYSEKKKSALLLISVETSDPVQSISGSRNSSKQNDIHLVCIFLMYSEPGSIAPAVKDDLQSCCL